MRNIFMKISFWFFRIAHDIRQIFSKLFLCLLICTTLTVCFGLYKITYDGSMDLTRITYSSVKLFGYTYEFFIYCIFGSMFSSEVKAWLTVGNYIYNSWFWTVVEHRWCGLLLWMVFLQIDFGEEIRNVYDSARATSDSLRCTEWLDAYQSTELC